MLYLTPFTDMNGPMNPPLVDRLVILTISNSQSAPLIKQLSAQNFRFTLINSTGGFLQEAVICLLIGFQHERMPLFLDIVQSNCHAYTKYIPAQGVMTTEQGSFPMVEARMGGATVFMMNVERFEQI